MRKLFILIAVLGFVSCKHEPVTPIVRLNFFNTNNNLLKEVIIKYEGIIDSSVFYGSKSYELKIISKPMKVEVFYKSDGLDTMIIDMFQADSIRVFNKIGYANLTFI